MKRPSRSLKTRFTLLVCLLAIFALSILPLGSEAQLPIIRFVRDPDPAPDFKVKDLEGKEISLADSKGKVVLLNFWASWCGPCRAEIPGLIDLQKKYRDRVQIIGLIVDDDDETEVRNVVKSEAINYPVAFTTSQVRLDYGGIAALPTVFVINADGRVVQKHVGLFDPELYETEVRALLDLPISARVETFNDTGEIFLKHADRATMLPGVNTETLNPDQRATAMHKFNAETCSCGCQLTLAQCRIYDPACKTSKDRTAAIVKELSTANAKTKPEAPAQTPPGGETPAPEAAPSSTSPPAASQP
jgi:cytochrome c biogenesis protein CcmG/thiol:disulfide interchange protein DsbE